MPTDLLLFYIDIIFQIANAIKNTHVIWVIISLFSFSSLPLSATSAAVGQMDSAGYTTTAAISIKALSTNTDFIYLGNTAALVGSSFGYALDPGESVAMNVINTNKIFAISNTGTQVITYLAT